MYEAAQQISVVSHTVLFLLPYPSPACCTALIIHCLLPLSVLCSRQVILDLCFQVMLCDKLYEVCSRSTDTIASIALSLTLNFLFLFFKGEKVNLLGMTSCPSAELVNWILHAKAFLFATALCYLSEKRCRKGAGTAVHHRCSKYHLVLMADKCSTRVTLHYCYITWAMKGITKADVLGKEKKTFNLKVKSKSDTYFFWVTRSGHSLKFYRVLQACEK